ncbi:MAG: TM2 domain-containing protein [Cryobacterium sp.]
MSPNNADRSQRHLAATHPPYPASAGYAPVSDRSFVATWLFAWLLGFLAVDRFYLGKVGTGLLKLVTLGGFGLWWLIDVILVLAGSQRDKQGLPLSGFEANKKMAWIVTAAGIVLSAVGSSVTAAMDVLTG